ncbi:MAG: DUF6599 family protein [Candidatus Aminicenantales bacterium]
MAKNKRREIRNLFWLFVVMGFFSLVSTGQPSSLRSLLPEVQGWQLAEQPQLYQPENLFEYIDGAAESYLSYDFQELLVAQYQRKDRPASLTVEIYRLASAKNAFGIYSAERYPESRFLDVGTQGYIEDGALNFVLADKYIKLLSFDGGEEEEAILQLFARKIEAAGGERGALPSVLRYFPREGLVANSEKFIHRNFLGYHFLHDGYLASYQMNGNEFELFLVEGENEEDAISMLEQFVSQAAKRGTKVEKVGKVEGGYHLQDRTSQNSYVAKIKNFMVGVMRIEEGREAMGLRYLQLWLDALK